MLETHHPGYRSVLVSILCLGLIEHMEIPTFNLSAALGGYPRSTKICLVLGSSNNTFCKHFSASRAVVREFPSKLCRHNVLTP